MTYYKVVDRSVAEDARRFRLAQAEEMLARYRLHHGHGPADVEDLINWAKSHPYSVVQE